MKTEDSLADAPFLTIRRLVALWAVSLFFAWTILVAGWLAANRQLRVLGNQVLTDVRALDAARGLELAILAHRREDLLWEATGHDYHRQRSDGHFREAEHIVSRLDPYVTTAREHELLMQIRGKLVTLRDSPTPSDSIEAEAQSVYQLLDVVERFQTQNTDQMAESVGASSRLHTAVSRGAIGLLIGTAGLLAAGSLMITRRILYPTLALAHATDAFGAGDFTARAPVCYDDELGALARTFNNMAEDIASREKGRLQFVAMVAHDLKNPVLAIEMAARLLIRSAGEEQQRDRYLNAVTTEAQRLRTIVRDLTDDIQVASGNLLVRKTAVDLCELVRQLIQAQAAAFSDHPIVLELQDACTVFGDASRIERVVMNLVSSAVKYSPAGTRVTVRVEKREPSAVLSVSDEGPGISQEDSKVIFQPFGRGRSADTMAEGTGMGLYVVKQIVEAHDGAIEVHSKLGQGTTFQVRLPLA